MKTSTTIASSEQGRELRSKRRGKLTLEEIEQELGSLTDLESVKKRLDRIGIWALAGMLTGVLAGAAVRSCEVWIKATEADLTNKELDELRATIAGLKAQLAGGPQLHKGTA